MIGKFRVITDEHGDVVGTQPSEGATDAATGATAFLVAGPGQTLHEIDFEIPQLTSGAHIDDFHRRLTEHLRKKPT